MNETAREQRLQIAAVELFVDVLGRADEDGQDRFYSRLAEAVCELGSMRRAVIFRYDEVLRRVRAAGGHGVDLGRFEEIDVTSQSSPLTRRALEEDRVLEVRSDGGRLRRGRPRAWPEVPQHLRALQVRSRAPGGRRR